MLKVGAAILTVASVYFFLTRETTSAKSRQKKKKTLTLKGLSKRVDHVINGTQNPRLAIVLLENLQLEVDGIPARTDKKRKRRKQLNTRINESLAQLEKEAEAPQPDNDMKGYKYTKDGRKTTFFHREVDEEAKKLIGDTAPKRINPTTTACTAVTDTDAASTDTATQQVQQGSKWNGGNTWESKAVTSQAKAVLREMLSFCAITKISGDVTLVFKKKVSLIYDLEIGIKSEEGKEGTIYLLSGDEPNVEGIKYDDKLNVLATFENVLMHRVNNQKKQ